MLWSSHSVWCCSVPRSGLSHTFSLGSGQRRGLGLQHCCWCYRQTVTALPIGFCSSNPIPDTALLSLSCMSTRTVSLCIYLCCLFVTCPWCSTWLWCTSLRATYRGVCEGALLCWQCPCDILQQWQQNAPVALHFLTAGICLEWCKAESASSGQT